MDCLLLHIWTFRRGDRNGFSLHQQTPHLASGSFRLPQLLINNPLYKRWFCYSLFPPSSMLVPLVTGCRYRDEGQKHTLVFVSNEWHFFFSTPGLQVNFNFENQIFFTSLLICYVNGKRRKKTCSNFRITRPPSGARLSLLKKIIKLHFQFLILIN